MTTAIVNYGMGNLRSVYNAVEALAGDPGICSRPEDLDGAERIILPGVGAFGDGMHSLAEGGWVDALERNILGSGKPFLGLCLGMQLMATRGTEQGDHLGLGWIPGTVVRLAGGDCARVPHIGWNDVRFARKEGLYAGQGESSVFYFVHSYVFQPDDPAVVSGVCTHGVEFVASVENGNLHGTQYHPEKSQKAGLAVLKRFLELKA